MPLHGLEHKKYGSVLENSFPVAAHGGNGFVLDERQASRAEGFEHEGEDVSVARGAKHARLVLPQRGGERRESARLAEEQFVLLRERST